MDRVTHVVLIALLALAVALVRGFDGPGGTISAVVALVSSLVIALGLWALFALSLMGYR